MSGFEGPERTLVILICGLSGIFGGVAWIIYMVKHAGSSYARLGLPGIVLISIARVAEAIHNWGTPVNWFTPVSVIGWTLLGFVTFLMYKDALKPARGG